MHETRTKTELILHRHFDSDVAKLAALQHYLLLIMNFLLFGQELIQKTFYERQDRSDHFLI